MARLEEWMLPIAGGLGPRCRRGAVAGTLALFVVLVAAALNATCGLGGAVVYNWATIAVYLLVAALVSLRAAAAPERRLPWSVFAVGLSVYGLGNVLWNLWISRLHPAPIPSICDACWLALYPLCYAAILGLAHGRRRRHLPAGVWLDGLIAGAGLAAVGAAIVLPQVIVGSGVPMLVELAYPVGDLLLAALVVGVLSIHGWRLNRTWALLVGGFVLLAVADCAYAMQILDGSRLQTSLDNLCYLVSLAPIALAAWQDDPEPADDRIARWSTLVIPAASATGALALLFADHYFGDVNGVAFGLAALTVLMAIVRTGLTFRDVRNLGEVRRQAVTDDLTALPNRRLFAQRIAEAVRAAELRSGAVTVLLIDLDRFKELNDTLGHHAGDALLRMIGPRLQSVLRADDVVARLGGDEFAILLDREPSTEAIAAVAAKLIDALSAPFEVSGLSLRVTASIGAASFPRDAGDADELLKSADVAMYLAKSERDGFQFYSRERDPNSRQRLALAGELSRALENGAIEVHFQPKASAVGREIVGAEALVRWRRPDGSLLGPVHFVDSAERVGLSRQLTTRVLEVSIAQLREWRERGLVMDVAVNTTVADLLDPEFPAHVAELLSAHDVPAYALILEVTERSLISDPARVVAVLAGLCELGVRLSLDDFGTGYSSLTHLKMLPVSELKIDRSFVSRMSEERTDAAIVYSMIELGHRLQVRVVAEGVEDEATWALLRELGCDLVQGYALARPQPAADLDAQLALHAISLQ